MADVGRRLAAEASGTALLVAAVVGSGIMAQSLTDDRALMLLANSLATGAVLVVLIAILGPVSGAHFNPAVTLALALRRDVSLRLAIGYAFAQAIGGIAGALLAHAMFALPILQVATQERSGAALWLSEGVATFGLVGVVILGARLARTDLPWLVGLYIVAAYWFTASTSFANPAVTLARGLTDTFSGIAPAHVPAFVVAQAVGALLAAYAVGWLLRPAHGP
jgi:glycerol uptake facilitator-like aquaporin